MQSTLASLQSTSKRIEFIQRHMWNEDKEYRQWYWEGLSLHEKDICNECHSMRHNTPIYANKCIYHVGFLSVSASMNLHMQWHFSKH